MLVSAPRQEEVERGEIEVSHRGSERMNKGEDYLIALLCIWSRASCLFGEIFGSGRAGRCLRGSWWVLLSCQKQPSFTICLLKQTAAGLNKGQQQDDAAKNWMFSFFLTFQHLDNLSPPTLIGCLLHKLKVIRLNKCKPQMHARFAIFRA